MNIYKINIELHDNLYYATREIGRFFETAPVLHNYSLCYALGLINSDSYRYFCPEQVPQYQEHLTPLNEREIYITPAKVLNYSAELVTWKCESFAGEDYTKPYPSFGKRKKDSNYPSIGRNKEISPEVQFECFLFSRDAIALPHWIRLGKWASKAEVHCQPLTPQLHDAESYVCSHPLNPLDVMNHSCVNTYDVHNMPPSSLIFNVHLSGQYYTFEEVETKLPAVMRWRFA